MMQLPLAACSRRVCQPPCLRHAKCPYEDADERARFRRLLRQRRAYGPVEELTESWMVTVEGYRPWPEQMEATAHPNEQSTPTSRH